jgi:predicted glycosyltransferase
VKIIHYCQYVLGIGHFFRSLEIARALDRHQVIMVTGGPAVEVELPGHVSEFRLPGLKMDADFTALSTTEMNRSLEEVQEERKVRLYSLFEESEPDLFLVELYPFGRKRFKFELLPVLEAIRRGDLGQVKVVCSLRDILVEKKERQLYEQRVLQVLNRYFDGLVIHADPAVASLEETFSSTGDIHVPVGYTGFVAPRPAANAGEELRQRLGISESEGLVVASAGGGNVGTVLLRGVLGGYERLASERQVQLRMFTGPFIADSDFASLRAAAASVPGVDIDKFTGEFLSYLAAADLSVSMAGYNTSMNLLATGVPALVWPFGQNREQRFRVERLVGLGAAMTLLEDSDLELNRLAALMDEALRRPRMAEPPRINLDGARGTAQWLESLVGDC